ncbi:50S ribosomal protein L13 [Buchnera aphidicola (Formosaphis micheliae)]|uniref:50S ribosomal protein L13 n=1 Tax=Buchnera aphidicola TaxID=9 RepID=UPI0031B7F7B6
MKSFSAKSNNCTRKWYVVDATDKILGRLATVISTYLRGKHKVQYTPHVDIGDYIIVLNAQKILVSGRKRYNKIYYHHTGYIGGIKSFSFEEMINRCPQRIIALAVKGMLPKGPLGRTMLKKLKVYAKDSHNHIAQKPSLLTF